MGAGGPVQTAGSIGGHAVVAVADAAHLGLDARPGLPFGAADRDVLRAALLNDGPNGRPLRVVLLLPPRSHPKPPLPRLR